MERRNRSLKVLERLKYIDSLDESVQKSSLLFSWIEQYLTDTKIEEFNLKTKELEELSELFYKNINFLKHHRVKLKSTLDSHRNIKEFLK